jgi:hypothetical protein
MVIKKEIFLCLEYFDPVLITIAHPLCKVFPFKSSIEYIPLTESSGQYFWAQFQISMPTIPLIESIVFFGIQSKLVKNIHCFSPSGSTLRTR